MRLRRYRLLKWGSAKQKNIFDTYTCLLVKKTTYRMLIEIVWQCFHCVCMQDRNVTCYSALRVMPNCVDFQADVVSDAVADFDAQDSL